MQKISYKSALVGTLGGSLKSNNVSISFPSNDVSVASNVVLSGVSYSLLPESVPSVVDAFSISVGANGPLNSKDFTLQRAIQIKITNTKGVYIYVWDVIANRWFELAGIKNTSNSVTGYTRMMGGTYIVTNEQLPSSFASSEPISSKTNSIKVPIYKGLGSFITYIIIISIIFVLIIILYQFKKKKR
jgi:hypothetical protein